MSHTSVIDIIRVNVGGHFTHLILSHHLSSSDWFELLGGSFSSHMGKKHEDVVAAIVVVVAIVVAGVAAVGAALTFLELTLS